MTWVGYSRKNLLFPKAQLWPHSNFGDEIHYIKTHKKLQSRLKGSGHILGPITGDHWFVYVADHSQSGNQELNEEEEESVEERMTIPNMRSLSLTPPLPSSERTINLMMFDMPKEVCSIFYQTNCPTGKEMTKRSGIVNLCPGAAIDETAFEPCGYSMNAILHDTYSTIHVTPQEECSYASFETNSCLSNYLPLVRNALIVFRPKRFVMTMFGDQGAIDAMASLPTNVKNINLPLLGNYTRTSVSSTQVEMDLCCLMACFTFDGAKPERSKVRQPQPTDHPVSPRERGHTVV